MATFTMALVPRHLYTDSLDMHTPRHAGYSYVLPDLTLAHGIPPGEVEAKDVAYYARLISEACP